MRRLLWLLLIPAAVAGAQDHAIYRCLDAKGHTTLQNEPCPAGSKVKGMSLYTPERPPTAREVEWRRQEEEAQRARLQRHAGTEWIRGVGTPAGIPPVDPHPGSREYRREQCRQARKARDDYQFQLGGQAADAMMRWHRKRVQDVCHGF